MSLLYKVKRKNTSEDFNNCNLKWQSIFCWHHHIGSSTVVPFLNGFHCNSQRDSLLSVLCCHDFCIKLSTTRIPAADVCRISRLLFEKSQRDISIYAVHMPDIRHIPAASDLL